MKILHLAQDYTHIVNVTPKVQDGDPCIILQAYYISKVFDKITTDCCKDDATLL